MTCTHHQLQGGPTGLVRCLCGAWLFLKPVTVIAASNAPGRTFPCVAIEVYPSNSLGWICDGMLTSWWVEPLREIRFLDEGPRVFTTDDFKPGMAPVVGNTNHKPKCILCELEESNAENE